MKARTRAWRFRHIATRYLDPVARPLAAWVPTFAVMTHRGRTSGRAYQTPINVFRRGDAYLFLLTYGADVDWVKNVLAAGSCSLRTRGHDVALVDPELIEDRELRDAPLIPRFIERRVAGVDAYLRMRAKTQPLGSGPWTACGACEGGRS
jgi:deazaflavin-dependent oxidoreductase (nitroreductase family)